MTVVMRYTRALVLVVCFSTVGSCLSSPVSPLKPGQRLDLLSVNGEPLPWSGPSGPIFEGWIQIDNDSMVERHEKRGAIPAAWTRSGRSTIRGDTLFVDYERSTCPSCAPVPEYWVDTFTVSESGLVRRELFPPDSIVRYYTRP